MENFPGTFPGVHGHSQITPNSEISQRSHNISPESIFIRKSLKSRKKLFKKRLVTELSYITYVFIVICYLYDCSLLLLALRTLMQTGILFFDAEHGIGLESIRGEGSVLLKQITKKSALAVLQFYLLALSAIPFIIHILRDLPIPNDDGYVYGHQTLQVIGQSQLHNKFWLLGFDILIFYLQIIIYSSQVFLDKERDGLSTNGDYQYDGFQGNIVAIQLPFTEALHPHFVSIEELKVEEEEELAAQNQLTQTDGLLDNNIDQNYGSINTDTGLGFFNF